MDRAQSISKHRNRNHAKAIRTNVTVHPVLYERAQMLVSSRGYNGLSDYLQACIRRDAGLESVTLT